jgi:hypothetical protein
MLRPLPTALTAALCLLAASACDGDGPAPSPRGEACESDRDCGALTCVADLATEPEDLAPLPLACGAASEAGEPGEPCKQDGDCDRGVCLLAGACARPCQRARDCGDLERCQPVFARRGPDALQAVSACVAVADVPASATVERREIEDALAPPTSHIDLDAVDGAETVLHVLEHGDEQWPNDGDCRPALCVRALRTRDSAPVELFDADLDYAQADAPRNPVAIGTHLHPVVVLLPIGSPSALSPAGYSVELQTARRGNLRVTRLTSGADGGRLDLNVFYLGALNWQPEGDRGPALLADALEIVDDILGQADIFVGELRQIAVPGELPALGTVFPDGDAAQGFTVLQPRFGVYMELPGLFRLSAGAANPAINLFFVQEIEPLAPGGEPEAQAGGIPGPLAMHGTGASGIAISTDMMAGNAEMLGRTLAHEIAHYLGLFHTSEQNGAVYEPLADTPECGLDQDAGEDGLSVADCEGHGADNLMFWAKTTGTVLTEQQRGVLRRALVLQ